MLPGEYTPTDNPLFRRVNSGYSLKNIINLQGACNYFPFFLVCKIGIYQRNLSEIAPPDQRGFFFMVPNASVVLLAGTYEYLSYPGASYQE
jgi:hypothetical protein